MNNFEVIAVWKVDRLSRDNEDVLKLINNYLKPNDIKLLVSTCDIDSSTSNGYMFISLLSTFAQYERTQIIERVNSGMEKRHLLGKWNGGIILGYDCIDRRLIINVEEKVIVQEIFELRAEGKGYKAIVNHINTKGYKSKKGNLFSINSVKTILENPTYIGLVRWGKHRQWAEKRRSGKQEKVELIKGEHEPIISDVLWDRVQTVNHNMSNNEYKSNFEGEFLLSGILKCPQCGKGMVMLKRKKDNGKGYYLYYQCQNFHQRGVTACKSNLVIKELIERKVLDKVKNLFESPKIVEEICNNIDSEKTEEVNAYRSELALLKKEHNEKLREEVIFATKVRKAMRENDEESEKGYASTLSLIVSEKEELEKRINDYEIFIKNNSTSFKIGKELILEALTNFHNTFELVDKVTKKQLISSLIKRIELESDRKTIKSLVLWFEEEDNLSPPPTSSFLDIPLPESELR
ncbi:recombinase family protein [Halalkalibacterium ligniniphilum]|uniref:recombinase family protein n=1 Tax=Halalkalibacterium ligniniphilum TaxID=1134413 RepID=UPI00034D733D|nr:recombinase family protein [Halalkalibacterium ligniniphilum]